MPSAPRLGALLRHLAPCRDAAPHHPVAAEAVAQQGAAEADAVAGHLERLERDGVTLLEDVYSEEQVAEWQRELTDAWRPLQRELPSLDWRTYHFKKEFIEADSFAVGKQLFEGKRIARRRSDGTGVIDLGRGRYDIYSGVMRSGVFSEIVDDPPPLLAAIADALLEIGYSSEDELGALPTLLPGDGEEGDEGGFWHRDACECPATTDNPSSSDRALWAAAFRSAVRGARGAGPAAALLLPHCPAAAHRPRAGRGRHGVRSRITPRQPERARPDDRGSHCRLGGHPATVRGDLPSWEYLPVPWLYAASGRPDPSGEQSWIGRAAAEQGRDLLRIHVSALPNAGWRCLLSARCCLLGRGCRKSWYNAEPEDDYDLVR